jgi:fumarylacetoacetase
MSTNSPCDDPKLKSWVESANNPECHFSIQNIPFGKFSNEGNEEPRVGAAIGDSILDLKLVEQMF